MNDHKARLAYEQDIQRDPNYYDGTARKTWDQLPDSVKQCWRPKHEGPLTEEDSRPKEQE